MAERFTAWCICPECGHFDCHWLREPHTEPVRDRMGSLHGRRISVGEHSNAAVGIPAVRATHEAEP